MTARLLACVSALVITGCSGSPFTVANLPDGPDDAGVEADAPDDHPLGDHVEAGQDVVDEHSDAGTDAPSEAAEADAGCTCVNDLSNVGLGDFAIAFTVTTSMQPQSPGYGALLNQRRTCDSQHPGWNVSLEPNGLVTLQAYDGSNLFDDMTTTHIVNDGAPHRVVLSRSQGGTKFSLSVDGKKDYHTDQAEDLSGMLVPLQEGIEPICAANMAQPSEPLVGSIMNVCIALACVPE